MTEKAIEKKIRNYLEAAGWLVWKNHGGPMSRAGLPDLMATRGGRFIAIEVKRPGATATALQAAFIHQLTQRGILAVVAHSVEEVRSWLGDA